MISDINDCKELWKNDVKIHLKWKVTAASKEHFDMVVYDKQGHDIDIVVANIFKKNFNSILSELTRLARCGTTVGDIGKHEIDNKPRSLTPLADVISWKWKRNYLFDVIGVVDEVCYTQSHTGGKKPQVNLELCDLGDNTLNCTLWEAFKIFFEVVHKGNTAKFVFWDREDGIIDPLEFPLSLDAMFGQKFAFKVKWDPKWKISSFVQFIKDNQLITMLEVPRVINQEGEITFPHVPDPATSKANVKRMSLDRPIDSSVHHNSEWDLSSTKVKKITKRGKKSTV
ncbi:unnamed protein product [Vicia faba]|uniref:DUF223 domain-containing protein n=1 Tax=Vicia faba TaxID=3906 RepID=A0AAV1B262_VICFA|nr:unnamed protein product [Vicia faba]